MMVLRCISMENYFKKIAKYVIQLKTPFSVVFKVSLIYYKDHFLGKQENINIVDVFHLI